MIHAHRNAQEIKVSDTRLFTNMKLSIRFFRDLRCAVEWYEMDALCEKQDSGRFECDTCLCYV